MEIIYPALAALAAYLLGSLSFAVIISRAFGLGDPRSYGSKNPGATNVLRSGNKVAAVLTLLLDAAKGWLPVMLVVWFGAAYGLGDGTVAMVGLAAFIGHVLPVFYRFKGGKGVATALGVLLGLAWPLGLAVVLVWGLVVLATRWVSAASLAAAALAPVLYLLGDKLAWYVDKSWLLAIFAMSLVLAVRHKDNIERLLAGTEPKLGAGKAAAVAAEKSGLKPRTAGATPARQGRKKA